MSKSHKPVPGPAVPSSELSRFALMESPSMELDLIKTGLEKTHIISIADEDQKLVYVNDLFCAISKYSREELIGQDYRMLSSGLHSPEFIKGLWDTIAGGSVWNNHIRLKDKEGSYFWLDTTIFPFINKIGKPYRYFSICKDITRIKQEENTLNQFFQMSQDYLCIANAAGYLTKVSPQFINELGIPPELIHSQPFTAFATPRDAGPLALEQELEKRSKGIPSRNFETKLQMRDGSFRLISWNASSDLETGTIFSIGRDITEIRKLNEEYRRLALVAESTDNVIVITDKEKRIQWVNRPFEKLTGYSLEEALGKDPGKLLQYDETDPETVRQIHEALEQKNSFYGDIKNRSKSGRPYWLRMNINPVFNENRELINFIAIESDVTEEKRAEAELIEAKQTAEKAVLAKDSFLANMSHEIRTPLNAILGFTDLLVQSNLNEVQSDYIHNIKNAGDHLLLIINDILDLSKIESGNLVIEANPFSLKNAMTHLYKLLRVKAADKDLEFSLFMDPDIPDMVIGDKGRLNQILMNLAGNAIKFTLSGEVIITVKKLEETKESVTLRFSIKDTGIGIPEEKLSTIFDRFTQAEDSTSRRFGGTGLGLNISKQLVELQKGSLHVKSKPGLGSEFYFILEYKKTADQQQESVKEKVVRLKSDRRLSILLCEDNVINQRLAKQVIENFGFDITVVNNGQECIDCLPKRKVDLILMDLQMPVMDGYQATHHIREVLKSDIPIIAMTAHSLVGEQQKCFEIGMNAYVPKPFKQEDLFEKIQALLVNRPGADRSHDLPPAPDPADQKVVPAAVDLSYLKELSNGNAAFEKEMIELFIQKTPQDIELLEKALQEPDYNTVKNIAHKLKSTFALFKLDESLIPLSQIETEAGNPPLSIRALEGFASIKQKLEEIMLGLQAILEQDYLS
ncbi:MAG TPA: PAS domain S-box protein [Saprospiraceae bacterium]|nr:PAS domain S-box protein [Saprospiraceae bacterium]HNT20784.1 PAS domain S-box protein [Saprospiraceae bacterium]